MHNHQHHRFDMRSWLMNTTEMYSSEAHRTTARVNNGRIIRTVWLLRYFMSTCTSSCITTVVIITVLLFYLQNIPPSTAFTTNKANSANKDRPYSECQIIVCPFSPYSMPSPQNPHINCNAKFYYFAIFHYYFPSVSDDVRLSYTSCSK